MANDHVKMFTEEYSPIAVQVGKQIGVSPTVLLAQWGMETDYGRKVPGHFNLGNIKDMSGAGTLAVDNQNKKRDNYVNFESPEAFGDYYANMMRRLYPKALNTGDDISKYAEGLRTGVKGSYAENEGYEQAIRGAHKLTSSFYAGAGDTEEPKKEGNPFEGYESESSKFKREQEERDRNKKPEANPEDQQGGLTAPDIGAGAGAITNLLFPPMTKPETAIKIDTGKAKEASLTARDKLEMARIDLENAVPQGTENLEETFRQSQGELERLRNEQRLAKERLEGIPKAPPIVEPPAPSSPFPQVTREGRASGPKIENDSGTRNWMIQEAGQKHQLPEVILDAATGKSKDSPTGGKALIDQDLANLETKKRLGFADYGLITLPSGVQLDLPPTTVAERQADIDKQNQANQAEVEQRAEQTRIQQETQTRLLEQQRALYEYEMERLQQQRAQAGQRHNIIAGQTKAAAPLQKALTKAETDAEVARRKLARAQEQPNAAGRVLQNVGAGSAKMGALPRTIVGGSAGYLGVMSYQEALARFKAGDTSEGVLKALEAGAAAAAVIPPAGKAMTKVRGAGVLGGLGLGTYELGRRLLKERPPEE